MIMIWSAYMHAVVHALLNKNTNENTCTVDKSRKIFYLVVETFCPIFVTKDKLYIFCIAVVLHILHAN